MLDPIRSTIGLPTAGNQPFPREDLELLRFDLNDTVKPWTKAELKAWWKRTRDLLAPAARASVGREVTAMLMR